MAVELGAIAPWLDNYPIYRQLWVSANRIPGNELKLVLTNRNLTLRIKSGAITVLTSSELQSNALIAVNNSDRGVVKITLAGDAWNTLGADRVYTCEILAYGTVYDTFELSTGLPSPYSESLNGVEVYASPREVLEVLGPIPGASVQTTVALPGWTFNAEKYWTKTLTPNQKIFGLWIDDLSAQEVPYERLALGASRQYARVGDTLYYKGIENLADPHLSIETGYSVYVLRSLREATKEIDRKTSQTFDQRRIYRELHRATYTMGQLSSRIRPVTVDDYFRLDCYSQSRSPRRRYTEKELADHNSLYSENALFVEGETGIITLTEHFWEWLSWGEDSYSKGFRGFNFFPPGEVSLELTYTAGYAKVPVDVSEAAGNLAAIRLGTYWQLALSQGMQGLSIGCVNMNFGDLFSKWFPGWQQAADAICCNYQHFEIEAF
jgi:hypothetical protein